MSKRAKSYDRPVSLDMDFWEALRRFAQTDPNEATALVDRDKIKKERVAMAELKWTKDLSTTDAQQPTSGGLVPYLRLTKGNLKHQDFKSWFRDVFFSNANWSPGSFGRENDIEVAKVVITVMIKGVKLGDKPFTITHGANRWEKHSTPNTWLHWPTELQEVLWENDFTGSPVTITRQADGKYRLEI